MVPNKTLETPNYKPGTPEARRPAPDYIEASYKLAEDGRPTAVTRRSQEPTNKQTWSSRACCLDAPPP